jgi:hypothetical protein
MFDRKLIAVLAVIASAGPALSDPARFDTPDAAVHAMLTALENRDKATILSIFGPENQDILTTGDAEQDKEIWGGFYADAQDFNEVVVDPPGRATLYFGLDRASFPFTLVLADGTWSFDGEGAREELRLRRIGRNELAVIDILGRASEIQAEYRSVDHDGDGVMEYASSLLSTPGKRDGLYWPDEPGTEPSPYNETIARASFTGFNLDGVNLEPEPLEGYYFLILQSQGPAAPGGAYGYMVGENMVAGYAVAAFPAVYGDTGVMSFMVGEGGIVYQADLGENTLTAASTITTFNPDERWAPVDLDE